MDRSFTRDKNSSSLLNRISDIESRIMALYCLNLIYREGVFDAGIMSNMRSDKAL